MHRGMNLLLAKLNLSHHPRAVARTWPRYGPSLDQISAPFFEATRHQKQPLIPREVWPTKRSFPVHEVTRLVVLENNILAMGQSRNMFRSHATVVLLLRTRLDRAKDPPAFRFPMLWCPYFRLIQRYPPLQ